MIKQNEIKYRAERNHLLEASLIALGIEDATATNDPRGFVECVDGKIWRMPAVGAADASGGAAVASDCAQPIVLQPRMWKNMFRADVPTLEGTALASPQTGASGGEASGAPESTVV